MPEALEVIKELLLQQQHTPWDKTLWNAEDIGKHLKLSARSVTERYACRPDFPQPVRIGGTYRWYAAEVCDWVEAQR